MALTGDRPRLDNPLSQLVPNLHIFAIRGSAKRWVTDYAKGKPLFEMRNTQWCVANLATYTASVPKRLEYRFVMRTKAKIWTLYQYMYMRGAREMPGTNLPQGVTVLVFLGFMLLLFLYFIKGASVDSHNTNGWNSRNEFVKDWVTFSSTLVLNKVCMIHFGKLEF